MDADVALREIREHVDEALSTTASSSELVALAELVDELDTWLASGGFKPQRWEKSGPDLWRDHVTPQIARDVIAHTGGDYPRPSHFVSALLVAMMRADTPNLLRLSLAYPGYAAAVHLWQNWHDGAAELHTQATRDEQENVK